MHATEEINFSKLPDASKINYDTVLFIIPSSYKHHTACAAESKIKKPLFALGHGVKKKVYLFIFYRFRPRLYKKTPAKK